MAFTINGTSGINLATQPLTGALPDANAPSGSVLQVVSVTLTSQQTYTSTTSIDVSGLSASITPTNLSNKILVIVNLSYSPTGNRDAIFQTVRNSSVIPTGVTGSVLNSGATATYTNSMLSFCQSYLDSPSTVSSTTYKVQVSTNADTIYINRRALDTNFVGQSTITLMEIAA